MVRNFEYEILMNDFAKKCKKYYFSVLLALLLFFFDETVFLIMSCYFYYCIIISPLSFYIIKNISYRVQILYTQCLNTYSPWDSSHALQRRNITTTDGSQRKGRTKNLKFTRKRHVHHRYTPRNSRKTLGKAHTHLWTQIYTKSNFQIRKK